MLEEEGHRKKIILASASPRRRKILELLKLDFEFLNIDGCFYNIAGLPVAKFVDLLNRFEFKVIG